jgi:Protein of unknown function (DUF3667)
MNCKTCGDAIVKEYEFCPHCGEIVHAHRLNIKHVVHELIHGFIHADKGIFLLVKELAYRPGKAALEYTEGSRKKYFNPVSFLLIAGGLAFFLNSKLGVLKAIGSNKIASHVTEFYHQATTPIIILTIPLLSLYSWLFFRATGKNYAENMVMNMYMMGEFHLFTIIVLILPVYLFPRLFIFFVFANIFTMAVYNYFTCKNFFNQSTSSTVIKVILIQVLYLLTFMILMAISILAYFMFFSGLHIKDLK